MVQSHSQSKRRSICLVLESIFSDLTYSVHSLINFTVSVCLLDAIPQHAYVCVSATKRFLRCWNQCGHNTAFTANAQIVHCADTNSRGYRRASLCTWERYLIAYVFIPIIILRLVKTRLNQFKRFMHSHEQHTFNSCLKHKKTAFDLIPCALSLAFIFTFSNRKLEKSISWLFSDYHRLRQ